MKKNLKITVMFLSAFISTSAFSSGIPTIDVSAISQIVIQIQEMQKQYEQMMKDYEEFKQMNENLTGISGNATIFNEDTLNDLFPQFKFEIQGVVDEGISALEGTAREIYEHNQLGEKCKDFSPNQKDVCEKQAALLALCQASYQTSLEIIDQRRSNINKLLNKAVSATTQKEISDLQVRIQGEITFLQAQQIKADMTKNYMLSHDRVLKQQNTDAVNNLFRISSSSDLDAAFN